jgi:hypothetical protein
MVVALGWVSSTSVAVAVAVPAQTVAVTGGPCGDPALGTECRPYFPDVARDPHGDGDDLLAVYRWAVDHVSRPSQLRMVRSRDGGATWQAAAPFVVAGAAGLDFRDPSLTTLRSGRLLLSYFVNDGTTTRTEVVHRDTDGVAFSAPAPVLSSTLPHPATSAKIVELNNGQLLIPVYGTPAGGAYRQSAVVVSVDGGLSWDGRGTGRQKTLAAAAGTHYQEPAIAEVAPGHVRAIMRVETAAGSGSAVQSDSYGGTYLTTWGSPWSLGVPMHGPELLAVPGTDRVPYLWSQPGAGSRPTMIAVRRGAVPWPATPRWPLYAPATSDAGYPGTVALSAARLVTVVYDEARSAIIAVRYPVTDVD